MDFAISHAARVCAVLPVRGVTISLPDNKFRPATPFELYYGYRPSISRFRVFGCPAVIKIYARRELEGGVDSHPNPKLRRALHANNNSQRGIRAIHVGFPLNQAGWLFWIPVSGHTLVSQDASFDENFSSPLVHDQRPFHDAAYTSSGHSADVSDPTRLLAYTGPPLVTTTNSDSAPWNGP